MKETPGLLSLLFTLNSSSIHVFTINYNIQMWAETSINAITTEELLILVGDKNVIPSLKLCLD